ncbi:MAG: cell wall hydrolase, partial [Sphingomonas sp.]
PDPAYPAEIGRSARFTQYRRRCRHDWRSGHQHLHLHALGGIVAPDLLAVPQRLLVAGRPIAQVAEGHRGDLLGFQRQGRRGARAVAQVVLNRLRHPAFPKTVCGVVFEGSERSTGCQFSFTCDGAVSRWKPSEAGWRRAREVATAALAGSVYRPVGYATHYHTDWVVPYWQSSLVKLAAVGSHLFFRWEGWWGTPPAFARRQVAGEPVIAQLAAISDAHRTGAALAEADAALAEGAAATGTTTGPLASDPNSFLVTLPAGLIAESFPQLAEQTCGDRPLCKFSAWSDRTRTPATLPLEPQQIATMTFSYLRDRSTGYQKALWNCQQIRRNDPTQCMKVQVLMTGSPVVAAPTSVLGEPRGPTDLGGVRRVR